MISTPFKFIQNLHGASAISSCNWQKTKPASAAGKLMLNVTLGSLCKGTRLLRYHSKLSHQPCVTNLFPNNNVCQTSCSTACLKHSSARRLALRWQTDECSTLVIPILVSHMTLHEFVSFRPDQKVPCSLGTFLQSLGHEWHRRRPSYGICHSQAVLSSWPSNTGNTGDAAMHWPLAEVLGYNEVRKLSFRQRIADLDSQKQRKPRTL